MVIMFTDIKEKKCYKMHNKIYEKTFFQRIEYFLSKGMSESKSLNFIFCFHTICMFSYEKERFTLLNQIAFSLFLFYMQEA